MLNLNMIKISIICMPGAFFLLACGGSSKNVVPPPVPVVITTKSCTETFTPSNKTSVLVELCLIAADNVIYSGVSSYTTIRPTTQNSLIEIKNENFYPVLNDGDQSIVIERDLTDYLSNNEYFSLYFDVAMIIDGVEITKQFQKNWTINQLKNVAIQINTIQDFSVNGKEFSEPLYYQFSIADGSKDCINAQNNTASVGSFVNCFEPITFYPNGRFEYLVTDIIYGGTYIIEENKLKVVFDDTSVVQREQTLNFIGGGQVLYSPILDRYYYLDECEYSC